MVSNAIAQTDHGTAPIPCSPALETDRLTRDQLFPLKKPGPSAHTEGAGEEEELPPGEKSTIASRDFVL